MTLEYAYDMWKRYLQCMSKPANERVLENPAIRFSERVKQGAFNRLSDDEFQERLDNVNEEASLFLNRKKASSTALFFRALQDLSLTKEQIETIARDLADASREKHELRKVSDETMFEELPFF